MPDHQIVQIGEGGIPIQSQLKVAAKHMKNLPPRFQRRLKEPGDEKGLDGNTSMDGTPISKALLDKSGSKSSKKNRYLLQGMDVYADDNGDSNPLDEQTTPNSVNVSSPVVSSPDSVRLDMTDPGLQTRKPSDNNMLYNNVMRCDDLEKELLKPRSPEVLMTRHHHHIPRVNPVMLPPMSQRPPGYFGEADKKPVFSIDAPEFIPRTTNSPGQSITTTDTIMHYPTSKADLLALNASQMAAVRSSSPYIQSHPTNCLSPQVLTATPLAVAQGRSSPVASYMFPPRNSPIQMPAEQRSSPSLVQQQAYMLQKMHASAAAATPKVHIPIPAVSAYASPYSKLHHPYAMNAATAAAMHHYRQLGLAHRGIPPSHLPYVTAAHPWQLGRMVSPAKLNLLPQHYRQPPYIATEVPTIDDQCKAIIKAYVDSNKRVMVILRGYPGSGKSVLAKYDSVQLVFMLSINLFWLLSYLNPEFYIHK